MEPIAIIGLSFKLPQHADNEERFRDMVQNGRNVMTDWPRSRANVDAFYSEKSLEENTVYARGGHFVSEDIDVFDAPFFSITGKEAAAMDPQQRWLLETSYRAFENAGIPVESLAGTRTSVHVAASGNDYKLLMSRDPEVAPKTIATGTTSSMLANKLSWFFDLKGPSLLLDTACSSSLVAVDLACQGLRNNDSNLAVVAGSSLLIAPDESMHLCGMKFLSPDSVCHSFDHRANGYARGEGAVVCILKRLSDAVRDGDTVRAVIRNTGTNQDGHTSGITLPSGTAQEELIRRVYNDAGLDFATTRYFEAHGTGTQVGDPIELNALGRVFKPSRTSTEPLLVGSIKANIGHLEGASGLAGLVNAVMILESGIIPPVAMFEKPNPKINVKLYKLRIPTSCVQWPCEGLRRISVNSFGFGGTNSHLILDDALHTLEELGMRGYHNTRVSVKSQTSVMNGIGSTLAMGKPVVNGNKVSSSMATGNGYPITPQRTPPASFTGIEDGEAYLTPQIDHSVSNGWKETTNEAGPMGSKGSITMPNPKHKLLVWSAKDESSLQRVLQQYDQYYASNIANSAEMINRLAYTLYARRSRMAWRSFAVADENITSALAGISSENTKRTSNGTSLTFVFNGQGVQFANMGLGLLHYPVFEEMLSRANQAFRSFGADWTLLDAMQDNEKIDRPEFSQPLCTALQIALIELMKSFNIYPNAVIGHSSGEIAAAYAAGALSFESACKVAYHRGRLTGQLAGSTSTPGAMISVNLAEDDVASYISKVLPDHTVHVACVNSPFNVTLSGPEASIDILKECLDKDAMFGQKLKTGVAYHSPAMQEITEEYLSCLGSLQTGSLNDGLLMVSSVTGRSISTKLVSQPQYWVDNLVSPVRYVDALQYLLTAAPKVDGHQQVTDIVEVGPHSALKRPISECITQYGRKKNLRYASALYKFDAPTKTIMELAGRLYVQGHAVSIAAVNQQELTTGSIAPLIDTPQYPFDRSQKYWHETRLGTDYSFRRAVPKEILGRCVTDWNPLEPRWRKILDLEETQWLADHVVGETALMPAAGMLVIAIEATKQIANPDRVISGFLIKEATFMNPIIIHAGIEGRVELMIQLRPLIHAFEKISRRSEIRIFTWQDKEWTECFKCVIHIEYEEAPTEVDGGFETRTATQMILKEYKNAELTCDKEFGQQQFYERLSQAGYKYGKTFATADKIRWDGHETSIACIESFPDEYPGIAHPATLDAAFHGCFLGPSDGLSKAFATTIPSKIENAWFSASGWSQAKSIRVLNKSKHQTGLKSVHASITMLADDDRLLCSIDQILLLPVLGNQSEQKTGNHLLHGFAWKPQLSLMSSQQLQDFCRVNSFDEDESAMANYNLEMEKALRTLISRQMHQLHSTDWSQTASHMQSFVSCMERELEGKPIYNLGEMSDESLKARLQQLEDDKPSGRIFIEIGRNVMSIVDGTVDPLELLFTSGLAEDFYTDFVVKTCDHRFQAYLELLSHENPNQKILEVGAGTGGLTNEILSVLRAQELRIGGNAFSQYVYTDMSPSFFENAKDRFSHCQERMMFQTLDVEVDITTQGFEAGAYDTIFAGSVLHATKNLSRTLTNLKKALKPGGKLIFHETTTEDCFLANLGFGVLPGWWLSEEQFRINGPTINEAEWDRVLKENGFSGNDVVFRDYKDDAAHYYSILVSTAQAISDQQHQINNVLFVVDDMASQTHLASRIANSIPGVDGKFEIITAASLGHSDRPNADYVVFMADMTSSLLASVSEQEFKNLQQSLQQWNNLLWVSTAGKAEGTSSMAFPYSGIKDGLLRTIRSEHSNKRILSLTIEDSEPDEMGLAQYISTIFISGFVGLSSEFEYVVRDGHIMSGRLIEESKLDYDLRSSIDPQAKIEAWEPSPPLKLALTTIGNLETLHFVEDNVPYTDIGPGEVEIKAEAWGLSFRDVFLALGRLPEVDFGAECAGIVTRVGCEVKTICPGDRAGMINSGCMRSHPRADHRTVFKLPDLVPFSDAAAIIHPAITAYWSLIKVAHLQKGEKILIHAAAGATGQLAILVAQALGAEIFATVGYENKKQLLISEFGIPADHIFYSRNLSFVKGIKRMTNGQGVDVVLNALSGEGLRASWECIAACGRFIEIGKADIQSNSSLPMSSFKNNVSFCAVDLRHLGNSRLESMHHLLHDVVKLWENGDIRAPHPVHIYPMSAVEDAFRYFQNGKNSGRIVLTAGPSDQVQKRLLRRSNWSFDTNATYVVAGGLGGLGRATLKWMASKGARHLIVPSRSGVVSGVAKELVDTLTGRGVRIVAPKCDVSLESSLINVLDEYSVTMPPIRGCINACMELNDSVFGNLTHSQWERTIRSKVQSSWNLHKLLPPNLDFYIMLSSLAGVVGNAGQANYAAGCTFQDALARYRAKQQQKTVSINLAVVRDIGIVAEVEKLRQAERLTKGVLQVGEDEFIALLDMYCDPNLAPLSLAQCQVTIGTTTPADAAKEGWEPAKYHSQPLFAHFAQARGSTRGSGSTHVIDFAAIFQRCDTDEGRAAVVVEAISGKLARALSIPPEEIDSDKHLHAYGVDSLVAVELKNWIAKEFSADVPVFNIQGATTIAALADLVAKLTKLPKVDSKTESTERELEDI